MLTIGAGPSPASTPRWQPARPRRRGWQRERGRTRRRVSVGKGYADEAGIEVGDRIELEGPSGSRTARVATIVDTVFAGGQSVGMSLETIEEVYGRTFSWARVVFGRPSVPFSRAIAVTVPR